MGGFEAFRSTLLLDELGGGNFSKAEVTSFDKHDNKLFCGTSNGYVVYFLVEELKHAEGSEQVILRSNGQLKKYLGQGKRAVTQLVIVEDMDKIILLCDGVLMLLNMTTLQIEFTGSSSLKGVTAFSRDAATRQLSNLHIACVRKKTLTFYELDGEKLILHKEWSLKETSNRFSWNGTKVCLAFQKEYCLLNVENGRTTTLFPFDNSLTSPLVLSVGHSEFLLTVSAVANVTLGMFVTGRGDTARAPLQWTFPPLSMCYSHPYIVAVTREAVEIHNIKDQLLKQKIEFRGGKVISFEHKDICFGSGKQLYLLDHINVQQQIKSLLQKKTSEGVAEALDLAETFPYENLDEKSRVVNTAMKMCGFVYFELKEYIPAISLFSDAKLDPRELIVLFESLSISGFEYKRNDNLSCFRCVEKLLQFDENLIREAKAVLLQYLELTRDPNSKDKKLLQHVDSVLVELYCSDLGVESEKFRSENLKQLLCSENYCLFWNVVLFWKIILSITARLCFAASMESLLMLWKLGRSLRRERSQTWIMMGYTMQLSTCAPLMTRKLFSSILAIMCRTILYKDCGYF